MSLCGYQLVLERICISNSSFHDGLQATSWTNERTNCLNASRDTIRSLHFIQVYEERPSSLETTSSKEVICKIQLFCIPTAYKYMLLNVRNYFFVSFILNICLHSKSSNKTNNSHSTCGYNTIRPYRSNYSFLEKWLCKVIHALIVALKIPLLLPLLSFWIIIFVSPIPVIPTLLFTALFHLVSKHSSLIPRLSQ